MPSQPALLIHGGATDRAAFPDIEATAAALDRIVLASAHLLETGASALETVAFAVERLEDDPHFNAGYGS